MKPARLFFIYLMIIVVSPNGNTSSLEHLLCQTPIKHQLIQLAKQSQFENSQQYDDGYIYTNTKSWLSLIDILDLIKCESALSHKVSDHIKQKLANWRANYPEHPAIYFYPRLFFQTDNNRVNQLKLAVIFPFDKNYEKYSDQLLKLFIKASKFNHWSLNVYDSNRFSLQSIINKIRKNQDNCIIGPLKKTKIKQFAKLGLHIPALTLNTIDKKAIGHNYLFKTSISDDSQAFQLKQTLNELNLHPGLLFYAQDKKAARELAADILFQTKPPLYEWRELIAIDSQKKDYSHKIKMSLLIDKSIERYNKLNKLIQQEIEFIPRRRQDINFIATSTSISSLESFYPQLNFWFLDNVPIFSLINEKEILANNKYQAENLQRSPLFETQNKNLVIIEPGILNSEAQDNFLIDKLDMLGTQAINIIKSTHCLKLGLTLKQHNDLWSFNVANKTFYLNTSN